MPVSTLFFKEGTAQTIGKKSEKKYFINFANVNVTWGDAKEIEVSVSNDSLKYSNDNMLFTDYNTTFMYALSSLTEKISVRSPKKVNSLSYKIMSSSRRYDTIINFMSISEMLARMGGIIQNMLLILNLFTYSIGYWSYEKNDINYLLYKLNINNSKSHCGNSLLKLPNDVSQSHCTFKDTNQVFIFNNKAKNQIEKVEEHRSNVDNLPKERSLKSAALQPSKNSEISRIFSFGVPKNIKDFTINSKVPDRGITLLQYLRFRYVNTFRIFRKRDPLDTVIRFTNEYLIKISEVSNLKNMYSEFQLLKYLLIEDYDLPLFEGVPFSYIDQIMKKSKINVSDIKSHLLSPSGSFQKKLYYFFTK